MQAAAELLEAVTCLVLSIPIPLSDEAFYGHDTVSTKHALETTHFPRYIETPGRCSYYVF